MKDMPTKERILYAALDLFAKKGYDGVGVDLIAENAGLKGPSLYRHYKGKEDIFNSLIDLVAFHYEEGLAPCNYILPSLVTTDYFENIDLTDHSSNNSNFYPGGYGETMLLLDATAMNLEDISRLAENPTYSSDMNITIYVTNAQYIDMHRILGFSEEDEEELRKLGVTINGMLNIKAIRNKFAVHPLLAIYEDTEA